MSERTIFIVILVLLTFLLSTALLLVANLEAARRITVIEKTMDQVIELQSKNIKRIDDQFTAMTDEDREIRGKITELDAHVDYYISGKWK